MEKHGIPTALIITTIFQDSVQALARAQGYSQFPAVVIKHPVAYLDDQGLEERARDVLRQARGILVHKSP